jgi:thiol-disulfide isomerase/thioredoxin
MKKIMYAVAAVLLATGATRVSAQDLGIQVGKKAPAAVVQDLAGRSVDLARYIGKEPALIEFWATWCPNCRELEPSLLALQRKYAGKVQFVGVAVSVNESPERVKLYVAKHGIKHDIVFDKDGLAADAYDVPATSYVVVINRAGTVVYTGLGGDQNLEAALGKALR